MTLTGSQWATTLRQQKALARGVLMPLLLAAALPACSGGDGGEAPAPSGGVEAPFFPDDFLTSYVQVRNCRFSSEHGGVYVQVYASADCALEYNSGTYPLPTGGVLVKLLYFDQACSNLVGYVSMRKGAAGTAPVYGDWEWQEVGLDRIVSATSGAPTSCQNCHSGCTNGRDFTCTDP